MTTRLVLVRHGESIWNAERRIQGQSGPGLSDIGHEQAVHTGRWVAEAHPDAAVVSSDLPRAMETATPIAEGLGVDIELDEGLRERHFGSWQGVLIAEIDGVDAERAVRWRDGDDVIGELGGEANDEFRVRVKQTLNQIADDHEGRTVIVVCHGGVVWHGIHAVVGLGLPSLGAVGNACVSELVRYGDQWLLESWNQTAMHPVGLRRTHHGVASAPPMGR